MAERLAPLRNLLAEALREGADFSPTYLGLTLLRHKPQILVLGAEPEVIRAGLDLSPTLQAALEPLNRTALRIVTAWMMGEEPDLTAPAT